MRQATRKALAADLADDLTSGLAATVGKLLAEYTVKVMAEIEHTREHIARVSADTDGIRGDVERLAADRGAVSRLRDENTALKAALAAALPGAAVDAAVPLVASVAPADGAVTKPARASRAKTAATDGTA